MFAAVHYNLNQQHKILMKPNLFEIATKELSQDAFITWLLKYADKSCQTIDSDLHLCAVDFVNQLIKKTYPNFNEVIVKVEAGRQWENIDVWAKVNEKYLIVIEDKTTSGKHSDQLPRYKEIAKNWCIENKYEDPTCIYLKTGNESQKELKNIVKEGFEIFKRIDIINILKKYSTIENNIFIEFKENLEKREKRNNEYSTKKIGEWQSSDFEGFYQLLEQEMEIVNWHKVDNPSGGFWNALLSWTYLGKYPTYLQLEERKLCFKISTHIDDLDEPMSENRGAVRNNISQVILEKAKEIGYDEIKKPSRFGDGVWMTVAVVESEYWLGKQNDFVDITKVVEILTKYLTFMKDKVGVK